MKFILCKCKECKNTIKSFIQENTKTITCPECHTIIGNIKNEEDIFEYCPVCDVRQFYLSKDFNQVLGCLLMLIGIVLVPITFGVSLIVLAFIDWLFHRKAKTIINCYKCACEFHGFKPKKSFKPFLHHIGLKYDKFR